MVGEPLHICLLSYRSNPRSGGQGVYVNLLTRELVNMGHRVDVWSGPPYPEPQPGVRLVKIPSLDLWNEKALLRFPRVSELRDAINRSEWMRTMLGEFAEPRTFTYRVARCFRELDGRQRYDIVHDNQSLGPGLLRVRERLPVVATIHHPVTMDFRIALEAAPNLYRRYGVRRWYSFLPMQRMVSRALDRVLTVSCASAGDLERDYGIDRRRLRVVGNGINLDVFRPRPEVKRCPDQLITTLSADMPMKGFAFLIEALAELRRGRPGLALTVIGNARPRSHTMQKIRRLGLEGAVRFTGHVPAEEIARCYAGSTLAVVPSLYEGFGFPAGEAMSCEVPVVSTRAGGLPEVVGRDGEAGILVRPGCAADLARGIRNLLEASSEARTRMGKAGRRRVEANFTWRRAAERTVESYREVIAERVGSGGRVVSASLAGVVPGNGGGAAAARRGGHADGAA